MDVRRQLVVQHTEAIVHRPGARHVLVHVRLLHEAVYGLDVFYSLRGGDSSPVNRTKNEQSVSQPIP